MLLDQQDKLRRIQYFEDLHKTFPRKGIRPAAVVITHLLSDRPFFVDGVQLQGDVVALMPKPKSINSGVQGLLSDKYHIEGLDRGKTSDPKWLTKFFLRIANN